MMQNKNTSSQGETTVCVISKQHDIALQGSRDESAELAFGQILTLYVHLLLGHFRCNRFKPDVVCRYRLLNEKEYDHNDQFCGLVRV